MMAVNLRLYTVLVLLTFFSCLPVDMVAALPAMPHYTIGPEANGGLSSQYVQRVFFKHRDSIN